MAWEQVRTDTIADNIANANTDGFKRSTAIGSAFGDLLVRRLGDRGTADPPPEVGGVGGGAVAVETVLEMTQGPLRQTDDPLDVAILGPGEFVFLRPDGLGYDHCGHFHRSPEGWLITDAGYLVLADGKPVGAGAQTLEIQRDGTVLADGEPAGRLDIRGADASTSLMPGYLEGSNVNLGQELTDLITALRSFQINQRALQMQDQTLSKAVNEVGRL